MTKMKAKLDSNSNERATLIGEELKTENEKSNALDCMKWFASVFCSADFVLLLILILYTLFGALVIHEFEGREDRANLRTQINEGLRRRKSVALEMCTAFCSPQNKTVEHDTNITKLPDNCQNMYFCVDTAMFVLRYWKVIKPNVDPWNIGDSLTYIMTIHTTIGYGSLAPVTVAGQIFTMVFALFGIPLALCVLARVGNFFCLVMHKFWSRLRNLLCGYVIVEDAELEKIAVEQRDFPLFLALGLMFGWLLASAGMLVVLEEDWSLLTSFYFSFITLSTIGLGDFLPSTMGGTISSLASIIIGLALVSMCINLLQSKLETLQMKILCIIQKKYATAQIDQRTMCDNDVIIDRLLATNTEHKFLTALVSRNRKRHLEHEWRRRANMRLKSTQTEDSCQDHGIQCDIWNHANYVVGAEEVEELVLDDSRFPYRETATRWNRSHQTDDVRRMIHEVHSLLDDCREIAMTDSHVESEC